MSNSNSSNISNSKTRKNNKKDYASRFANTPLIPNTTIIRYIFKHYQPFVRFDKKKLAFDTLFNTNDDFNPSLVVHIDRPIESNNSFSLTNLIACSFYICQKSVFEEIKKHQKGMDYLIDILKFQIGKDVRRDTRSINGQAISFNEKMDHYQVTDSFYKMILQWCKKQHTQINYNILNKIGLLSCQNIYNLMSGFIEYQMYQMTGFEWVSFRPTKSINIIIDNNEIRMEFNWSTKLLLTSDHPNKNKIKNENKNADDFIIGNNEYTFVVDLKKNTYSFTTFTLNYDIQEIQEETPEEKKEESKNSLLPYFALGATGALVSTPFLLGLLGGKTKKHIKNNTRYTRRRRIV